jgi:5-formyltetrahydrofolate cyclo-ligase
MAARASSDERTTLIWSRVYQELIQDAVPDARFNYDFMSFTPDFRGSAAAVDRLAALPCYQSATTVLVTPDNSLELLRARALKDGKTLLVATYRLRRGFILLHPARIHESRYELAACLDGMEKPGAGRPVTLAQMRDEGLKIDMCVIGGLIFNVQGVAIWGGDNLFEVQWALLQDIGVLRPDAPVAAIAHASQVVDEARISMETIKPTRPGEVQCDFVVTPAATFEVCGAVKPTGSLNFDTIDPDGLQNIPPLQELRGIRMMESIMQKGGFGSEQRPTQPLSTEEQMGISIVDRLMQNYKS